MSFKMKLFKAVCEYRFKSGFSYYDEKNKLADSLFVDYKHWNTNGLKIALNNFENRSVLSIENNRLILEFDVPNSIDEFVSKFKRALKEYREKIPINQWVRLGVRLQSMIPVDFNFPELVSISQEKLLPQDESLRKIIGVQLDDYMFNVVTEKKGFKMHFICGPVKREEIARWYQPADIESAPGERLKEIEYPDVALFIDCDCYLNEPDPKNVTNFLENGVSLAMAASEDFGKYVFGEK